MFEIYHLLWLALTLILVALFSIYFYWKGHKEGYKKGYKKGIYDASLHSEELIIEANLRKARDFGEQHFPIGKQPEPSN